MIIKDALVVTPRSDAPLGQLDVKVASIGIEAGKIQALGSYEAVRRECPHAQRELDCRAAGQLPCIAMPGFVDGHSHSRQIAFHAYWQSGWRDKLGRPQTEQEARDLFRWFLLDAVKAGVTYVCDWPEHPQLWNPRPLDEELRAMGLRGCLRVLLPHNRGEPWPDVATAAARLRCTLRELPEEIRLGVWIPEEDKPEFQDSMLAWLGQLQAAMDGCPLLFQMHLAESRKRRAACDGAIFRLFEQGLIPCSGTARTALIHAIWLDPTELRALVGRRDHLGVITCPKFVDGRLAPIKELLQGGVPVGLGSDVAAADPLGLIRTLTALHQSRAESLRLSAGEAFHIATLGGAGVLGLEKQIGSLEAGKDADIVLLRSPAAIDPDLIAPGGSERHSQEKAKVIERLFVRNVLRREHIDTVIVAGRVIVDGGTLISRDHEAAIVAAGKRAAGAIVKRLVSAGREARNGE